MKRVVIESPYKGKIPVNEIYGELCMNDCLVNHNESPYASHLLYTRTFVLRDDVPEERKLGIEAGFYWRDVAEQSNFYIDLGMTDGMKLGIDDCEKKGKPYEVRNLPDNLWKRFVTICIAKAYGEPKRMNRIQ
jgi:hypothetical protein